MVFDERRNRFLLDVDDVAAVGLVVGAEEVGDELRDVFAAAAKRRDVDRDDVEPVVEILAKVAPGDLVEKLAVARRDHAGVDADRLGVTDPLELALLENAEELHLELGGRGIDLVEEDRAGVGRLEAAGPVGDRPGERSADMPKQLALEEALGEGPAVDAHERSAPARRELVDRLGDQFLPRAGLADQEHRGV